MDNQILSEKDFVFAFFKEAGTRAPMNIDASCIHNYTMSFDKKGITLSLYFTDLKQPLNIQEIQQAKSLSIHYSKFDSSGGNGYEIMDVVGSTQGNENSDKPLSYTIQFSLK